jgi:hypothetical protein
LQTPRKYPFIKAGPKAEKNTNVQLVQFLEDKLPKEHSYKIFTDNLYVTGLLSKRFTEPTLIEYSFDFRDLKQFLYDKEINLIITTPKTNSEPYLRRDSTWNNFLKDPANIGFKRVPAGKLDSTYQLYIKQN